MTKLASENATNKANAQGFSLKEGRAAVDGQVAVDPSAKAAVAAPLKAAVNGKAGAGIAAPAPVKVNPHADAVKKDERDEDGKHINKVSDEAEGQVQHLAMVDASSAASVGALSPEAGQDAGGAPADSSDDNDGGISAPLIIGGVLLVGGGVALAAGGGGGKKNVAPTLPATGTATTNEDTAVTVTVTATDPGDTVTYTAGAATNGTVTGGANGAFVFTPAKDFNGTATFTVTATDSKGLTATQTVTVTVVAVNDAPVAVADVNTATEDGAIVTGNVSTNDTDVDTGDTKTYSLNAPVAGLTLNANGTYSFDPTNAAYQNLAQGETRAVVANYTLTDSKGATATSTLTITVTGVNDAPVAVADVAAATEGGAVVTGNVSTNDTDVDAGDTKTYSLNAAVPGLTLNANGTYSFDPTNAAYDNLAVGQTRDVVANYTLTDSKGATSVSTLTITVTGTNDAPVAVDDVNSVLEGAVANGSVATNDTDVDAGAVLTYTVTGAATPGLTFNPNGSYIFNAADPAYDSLKAGQVQNVVINYTVNDGNGGSDTGTLTVTVTGVNDAPVITSGATASVIENLPISTIVYDASATDVDTGETATLVYSLAGADAALFNIDSATGEVRLNASANFEAAKNSYAFTVVATDVHGATGSKDVVLSVTNAVDIFNLEVGTPIAPVTIDARGTGADVTDVNYQFNEGANLPNDVIIQHFGANDYIQFSSTLLNYNFNNLNGDLVITQNNGGVVSHIVIDDIFDPGLQLDNNVTAVEAALNAALGTTDVDYLRGSTFPAVTRSADVDNDNDSATPASATGPSPLTPVPALDASQAAVTYTENGNIANTVIISNFTSDDHITVTNAPAGAYSFGTPNNQDLVITWNNNGVVNEIRIEGFFQSPPPLQAILGGEATIEAFVGFDFFSYA